MSTSPARIQHWFKFFIHILPSTLSMFPSHSPPSALLNPTISLSSHPHKYHIKTDPASDWVLPSNPESYLDSYSPSWMSISPNFSISILASLLLTNVKEEVTLLTKGERMACSSWCLVILSLSWLIVASISWRNFSCCRERLVMERLRLAICLANSCSVQLWKLPILGLI